MCVKQPVQSEVCHMQTTYVILELEIFSVILSDMTVSNGHRVTVNAVHFVIDSMCFVLTVALLS